MPETTPSQAGASFDAIIVSSNVAGLYQRCA